MFDAFVIHKSSNAYKVDPPRYRFLELDQTVSAVDTFAFSI
jgi:hypothetical protein